MAWFRKKLPEPIPAQTQIDALATLAELFAKAFTSQIENNTTVAQVFSGFIGSLGEMSTKQAARIMGQRSAARRGGAFKQPRKIKIDCPLCANPGRRDVSVEMIKEHRKHGEDSSTLPPAGSPSSNGAGLDDVAAVPPEIEDM